jgi:NAD(P)H-dependent flavin oxidoreductase YrpB (nitropropane dioxygenase family)
MLYRSALVDGNADIGVMATGQVVGLIDDVPSCAELIDRIAHEAESVLDRLGGANERV